MSNILTVKTGNFLHVPVLKISTVLLTRLQLFFKLVNDKILLVNYFLQVCVRGNIVILSLLKFYCSDLLSPSDIPNGLLKGDIHIIHI